MAPQDNTANGVATETSPLLINGNGHANGKARANGKPKYSGHTIDEEYQANLTKITTNGHSIPHAQEPSTGELLIVMSSVWFGTFLAALDSTIIATLSAPISNSFNSLSLLSWIASAYFIAQAACQPLSGRLTDIFGRRAGLIFANTFFAAGNLICGLATEQWVIIFGRVVAGMGGGGLTAISTFVGSDLVPLRRRGVWQGFGNISFGVGAGLGGVFGGWINDTWGWRKAFLIQVPLTVLSGLVVFFTVKIPVKHSEKSAIKRVDFLGACTLVTALVMLLLGLNSGGNIVPWNHPLIYTTLPLSFISLLVYIHVEATRASEPIIPVPLLLNRTVLAACLANWFYAMTTMALLFYGPLYFQVRGFSATEAGAAMIPQSIGIAVGSIAAGLIMRWTGKYYILGLLVQAILIAANIMTSFFTLSTATWLALLAFLLVGIGYSGMLTTTLVALISAVEHKEQAVITSASYVFRSTGCAIGITVASAVFQNILKLRLRARFGDRSDAAEFIKQMRDNLEVVHNLPLDLRAAVLEMYMEALKGMFLALLGIAVLGALASLAMREHTLHRNLERK
ncbi:hypothetical protein N7G274_002572 [Stereocaulon virgatum]|uniref:Major facilitator superfamily (MFS) profile domain-containing protein n=1 Tax=Stereocaulon virgatum TaxID=373712 RepID=A0ABR4AG57_9LECA